MKEYPPVNNIYGTSWNDYHLYGTTANDYIHALQGDDFLFDGDGFGLRVGDDAMYGGKGDDTITTAGGKDVMWGQKGDDTFIVNPVLDGRHTEAHISGGRDVDTLFIMAHADEVTIEVKGNLKTITFNDPTEDTTIYARGVEYIHFEL